MNGVLLVIGIIVSVILVASAVAIFVLKKNRLYGALMLGFAIVLILAMMIGNRSGKPEDPDVLADPSASVSDTAAPSDGTASPTETPASGEPESNPPAGTATAEPTAEPTTEPTAEPTAPRPENWNGSTIYLTFDDGPSMQVTPIILDTLKKYNVKATFFVVDYTNDEIPILKRIVEEGHSLGIHGYSHDYAVIYQSVDAFMENITKLSDRLKNDVGIEPKIIRFPGGSSNGVSKDYCPGIMTELTKLVIEKGYQYFDWNVSPEDAMTIMSAEEISAAVIDGLRSTRAENVVLMHDAGAQITSGQAVEAIIRYALEQGYALDRLTLDTPPCHHQVFN